MADDTAVRAAAQHYMSRGWAVIPLYGVRALPDGRTGCACGNPQHDGPHTSGGKHPIGIGGRGDGWMPPLTDPADLPAGANIGLKTGHVSGVFALDVDPHTGGDVRLAELEAQHGPLPGTWMQRTGSGGTHFAFSLPDDFTPTTSRGRLPVGLDIRGEGGQIVLAPSTSTTGPYESASNLIPTPVLPAPDWLLELIRPLPPIEIPAGLESAYMPEAPTDRGTAYAAAAVREELSRLEAATPGSRNHTAFRVACRLIELANAPWSGLTEAQAYAEYERFGYTITDATFPQRELWAAWHSAVRRIGYAAAVLPAPPGGEPVTAEWGDLGGAGTAPPFSSAGGPPGAATPPPATASPAIPGQRDPFDDAIPGRPESPPGVGAPSMPDIPATTGQPHLRDFLLPRSQLSRLARPVPIIQGALWRDTDAWLIGESGSGKSFVALDWAAHIASGRDWNHRRTLEGCVLYVVAEGASGIQQRVDAWEAVYGAIPDKLVILPVAVQAAVRSGRVLSLSPQWRQLCEVAAELRPVLSVLDTQARMTRGIGENDNDEMGHYIEAVGQLRRASPGSCALSVHHIGSGGTRARGATAIDGAQDTEWRVERTGAKSDRRGRLVLDKSKDGEDGLSLPFAMKVQQLGWDPVAEEYVSSLVISYDPFDQPEADRAEHRTMRVAVQAQILEVLREGAPTDGVSRAEIRRLVARLRATRGQPQVSDQTINYALDSSGEGRAPGLLQQDLVAKIGQRYADKERYEASL